MKGVGRREPMVKDGGEKGGRGGARERGEGSEEGGTKGEIRGEEVARKMKGGKRETTGKGREIRVNEG